MFYIVETNEQLEQLINKCYDKVFIEPIYSNNNIHPALNNVSLLYIKPLIDDKGYMVCINHTESLKLESTLLNALLASYKEIYVRDRKSFIYHYPLKNIIDISFNIIDYIDPTTPAHDYYYQRHGDKKNINEIIPLVKHYEKCELIFQQVKKYCEPNLNNKLINVFFAIEKNGIKINLTLFDKFFEPNNREFSIQNNKIYTCYNLHTTTGRPSNSFNGINFAALNKEDKCREAFIPENDYFIEIDISPYHPTLISKLIGFDFGKETPYEYFAREANIKLEDAKILLIKQLYGGVYKEYKHINFLNKLDSYINEIWKEFKLYGSFTCPSGHVFYDSSLKNMNAQKLLSYITQNYETSNNILIMWNIIKLLLNKTSKIVLYTYDSILIDYYEDDNILQDIQQIFKSNGLRIKTTKGQKLRKHDKNMNQLTFEPQADIYNQYDFNTENIFMNNRLFATFTQQNTLNDLVDNLSKTYDIMYKKMFVLFVKDTNEYIITYNVEDGNINNIPVNTILVHKKDFNVLYSINALNDLIKKLNGGFMHPNYKINWADYKNSILLTQQGQFKQLNTKIYKIINL